MVVAAVASLILNFVSHEAESLAQRECDVITARPIESQKNPHSFRYRSQETHEIRKRSPSSNAIITAYPSFTKIIETAWFAIIVSRQNES